MYFYESKQAANGDNATITMERSNDGEIPIRRPYAHTLPTKHIAEGANHAPNHTAEAPSGLCHRDFDVSVAAGIFRRDVCVDSFHERRPSNAASCFPRWWHFFLVLNDDERRRLLVVIVGCACPASKRWVPWPGISASK